MSGVTPPGRKSEYLFLGNRRASSAAGYQISVTRVRGSLVRASVRLASTKTVVVIPTGKGPGARESSGRAGMSSAEPDSAVAELSTRTARRRLGLCFMGWKGRLEAER